MGRWAQRRLRGGGGPTIAAVAILSITQSDVDTADVLFSTPVTAIDGLYADAALTVDGNDVQQVTTLTPTSIRIVVTDASSGNPWSLVSQPAWTTTPLTFPASGLVLA